MKKIKYLMIDRNFEGGVTLRQALPFINFLFVAWEGCTYEQSIQGDLE